MADPGLRPSDLEWSERIEGKSARFVLTPSRMTAVPVLVFAALWDSFIVMFYMGLARSPNTPAVAYVFPFLHAAVGVVVTWQALVRCLNESRISIGPAGLLLANGPIPSRGARAPVATIEGFDAIEVSARRSASWAVRMRVRDQLAVKLPLRLESGEHAAFVAARLSEALAVAKEPLGYRDPA